MMRRMLIAVNVPEGNTKHDVALDLEAVWDGSDPTVWEWAEFFQDIDDGVVGPHHDGTEATT